MELIIHILEAVIVACMAFVMVIAVLITRDLSKIIENMNRKIDTLQHNEESKILNAMMEQEHNRVRVDYEKPLDFPNGD